MTSAPFKPFSLDLGRALQNSGSAPSHYALGWKELGKQDVGDAGCRSGGEELLHL